MTVLVADSSVLFKWLRRESDEPKVAAALTLLEKHLEGEVRISCPDLVFYEIGNVLKHKQAVEEEQAKRLLEDLFEIQVAVHPIDKDLALRSLEIGRYFDVTFYDAAFLALAERLDCTFVTADEKLFKKTAALTFARLL